MLVSYAQNLLLFRIYYCLLIYEVVTCFVYVLTFKQYFGLSDSFTNKVDGKCRMYVL